MLLEGTDIKIGLAARLNIASELNLLLLLNDVTYRYHYERLTSLLWTCICCLRLDPDANFLRQRPQE